MCVPPTSTGGQWQRFPPAEPCTPHWLVAAARRFPSLPPTRRSPPRSLTMKYAITLDVNGISYPVEIDPHMSLLNAVRNELGLTGSKEGCDDSECGACMMLIDDEPINACSYLAIQAN